MKYLLTLLIFCSISFPLQVIGHDQFNEATEPMVVKFIHDMGLDWAKPALLPISGIVRHMGTDYFVSEGNLGEFQVLRGGIKLQTVLYTYPQEEYQNHFWIAFWSVFPDLWDKGLGRNDFHWLTPHPIVSLDRDGEETVEDILVANRVWKSIAPKGTIVEWKIPIL